MNELFDFNDIEKSEETIKRTWAEFRNALAKGNLDYKDIDVAKKHTFLKVLDDLYEHMYLKMQTSCSNLNSSVLLRGTILDPGEVPDYNRMLPNALYIKKDNRFSPIGVEWLYLTIGKDRQSALSCARSECRVKEDDRFASCVFKIDKNVENDILIDLTVADDLSISYINNCLQEAGEKYKNRLLKKSIKLGMPVPPSADDTKKINSEIEMWAFRTYMKLLSEQIFLPVNETDDKRVLYSPFQCLAQYFISKGAIGIIYKSTVSDKGKNIVLFDKTYAYPFNDISIDEPSV